MAKELVFVPRTNRENLSNIEQDSEIGICLIHLIACGLCSAFSSSDNESLDAIPSNDELDSDEWSRVFSLAKANSVESLAWSGARLASEGIPSALTQEWATAAETTLWRRLQFDVEREQILEGMKKRGLAYLPLKGIHISNYYPDPSMRSMADNDILYGFVEPIEGNKHAGFRVVGATERERLKSIQRATSVMTEIMVGQGYEAVHLGKGNHDSYQKPPCFNFEMHRKLVLDSKFNGYYANPWLRAKQDECDPNLYYFSDEDEYIFHIAHAFKHFDSSGCGVRCAVDEYVFLKAKSESFDWEYISRELSKQGTLQFEKKLRSAALEAFSSPKAELSEETSSLLFYMLGCGTYGSMQERISKALAQEASDSKFGPARYIKSRIFLSEADIESAYPFFYRHKPLRPFLVFLRLGRAVVRFPSTLRELRVLRKTK